MVPGIPHVAHAPSYDWSGTGIVMRDFDPIPPMFVLASDKKDVMRIVARWIGSRLKLGLSQPLRQL